MRSAAWLLIIFGAIITVYDFLLGKSKGDKRRQSIRSQIGDFWVWAEESDWTGLASTEARVVLRWFYNIFGSRILSLRFFASAVIISIIGTLILYILVALAVGMSNLAELISFKVAILFPYVITNALLDYVSLIVTILVLRLLATKTSMMVLITGLTADGIVLYATSCIAYWIAYYWMRAALMEFPDPEIVAIVERYARVAYSQVNVTSIPSYLNSLTNHLLDWHATLMINLDKLIELRKVGLYGIVILSSEISILIILTSSIPTLIHANTLLAFVLSKILWRPIRHVVAVVAGAVYEASTSPIALLGIVCSGVGLLMLRIVALD